MSKQPELLTEVLPSQPVPAPHPELLTEVLPTKPKRQYCSPVVIDDTQMCLSCNC